MKPPLFTLTSSDPQRAHTLVIGPTRKGTSALLQAEASRLGISYEEMERRLEPTVEQKANARMKQEERDRREAARLDAVRQAYWDNTDKAGADLHVLSDALTATGISANPTIQQQRILFMMLPASVFGQGVSWGFSDTEVREQVHAFVAENRDAVAKAVSA